MDDILYGLAVVVIIFIGLRIHFYLVSLKNKRDKKNLMNEYYNKTQRGM